MVVYTGAVNFSDGYYHGKGLGQGLVVVPDGMSVVFTPQSNGFCMN